jgi:hypothetical protein
MTTRVKKESPDPKKALAMRERQSAMSRVLTRQLGPITKTHPELWAHRTFLLIVGKVYEHLVLCEAISPKELLDLTKTLVESCKIDAKGQETTAHHSEPGGVVDGLERMVRQVYGTNLQSGETTVPPSEKAITKTD